MSTHTHTHISDCGCCLSVCSHYQLIVNHTAEKRHSIRWEFTNIVITVFTTSSIIHTDFFMSHLSIIKKRTKWKNTQQQANSDILHHAEKKIYNSFNNRTHVEVGISVFMCRNNNEYECWNCVCVCVRAHVTFQHCCTVWWLLVPWSAWRGQASGWSSPATLRHTSIVQPCEQSYRSELLLLETVRL